VPLPVGLVAPCGFSYATWRVGLVAGPPIFIYRNGKFSARGGEVLACNPPRREESCWGNRTAETGGGGRAIRAVFDRQISVDGGGGNLRVELDFRGLSSSAIEALRRGEGAVSGGSVMRWSGLPDTGRKETEIRCG
jgi:hypothetical protein